MKKLLVFFLVVIMMTVLATATMASTIPVGITPGLSLDFLKEDLDENAITYTAEYGLNEKLSLGIKQLDYGTPLANGQKTDTNIIIRYAIWDNLSLALDYQASNNYDLTVGARYKLNLNDKLAFASQLDYTTGANDYGLTEITGQVEYNMAEFLTANLGYYGTNEKKDVISSDSWVIGAEVYFPDEKWVPYVDCHVPADWTPSQSTYSIGFTISF